MKNPFKVGDKVRNIYPIRLFDPLNFKGCVVEILDENEVIVSWLSGEHEIVDKSEIFLLKEDEDTITKECQAEINLAKENIETAFLHLKKAQEIINDKLSIDINLANANNLKLISLKELKNVLHMFYTSGWSLSSLDC